MNPLKIAAVLISGIIGGALFGALTRPAILGMPVPLGVLTSDAPLDAPFRQELIAHLALSVGVGAIGAVALLVILAILTRSRSAQS